MSDQLKHTPGPWTYWEDAGKREIRDERHILVAIVRPSRHHAEANAHLLASAPDLLAALQAVLPHLPGYADHDHHARPHITQAIAAIQAAKGEA